MKKIAILIIPVIFMFSCQNKEKMNKMQDELTETNAALKERDSLVTQYLAFVTEIEKNLNEIRDREAMIELNNENMQPTNAEARDQMIKDIKTINALMDDNKQKIADLNAKLQKSSSQTNHFRQLVNQLNKNIEAKETELSNLNEQLIALNENNEVLKTQVDSLATTSTTQSETIAEQSERIEDMDNEMHTAYIATGTLEELENKELVKKEGGVLGLGAVEKLSATIDKGKMIPVDIRQTYTVSLDSKKAELISNHPDDSYEIIMNDEENKMDKLVIVDPGKFWSTSKYLVVVKK